jgi:hypothetical protein
MLLVFLLQRLRDGCIRNMPDPTLSALFMLVFLFVAGVVIASPRYVDGQRHTGEYYTR